MGWEQGLTTFGPFPDLALFLRLNTGKVKNQAYNSAGSNHLMVIAGHTSFSHQLKEAFSSPF